MPPELGFQDQNQLRLGYRTRDVSPDSVIFTPESNFTIFSSASGSVDRCSFASDVHDHESLASEFSQEHLAGHDLPESSSGPDPDPNKSTVLKNSCLSKRVEKGKVQKEDNEAETKDGNQTLDSERSSFSQAIKECQDRRSRYEALLRRPDRRRPASLDLNNFITNATSSSPRFGVMKKNSVSNHQSGTCPSPGTPNYRHASVGIQKGWSSERVPLHANANRRHVGAAFLPFNNGRTLPSKWEDAERWIFSPIAGDGPARPSFPQPQRRQKSKSGPLGPPGIAYYSLYSPAVPMLEGGNVGNLMARSPFSAGVMVADGLSIQCGGGRGGGGGFPECMEPCMARSVSVHGCSELLSQSSLPGSQDEKLDGDKDAAISRRDMATQMSPELSPKRRPSLSPSTPSAPSIVELQSIHSSKLEVRDVQVDERVTVTRWSKKHKARFTGKGSENVDDWKKKAAEARSSAWEVSETAKSISKVKREEAKITAWENLQKAKAEAEIRKLEMKLEKKRSSSMDKIMNKLRSAQRKAQEMRSSVIASQAHQVARTSHKVISFRRTRRISSLSGCFTCHAF
uniref:Remorin C-terminal domain-containing protein n=1 Tax=Davidia involucrata TaxID=16924 RepID=A0A5B6Z7B8_DAVIN